MGMSQHISTLVAKHAQVDDQISREAKRPLPDWVALNQLKREKLRLKEELDRIAH